MKKASGQGDMDCFESRGKACKSLFGISLCGRCNSFTVTAQSRRTKRSQDSGLGIIKLSTPNFLRTVETCIREGTEIQIMHQVVR